MPDQRIDLPGATLAMSTRPGRGPTVVGLHGLTSSRTAEDVDGFFGWSPVAAGGRTLVRYDARGHGDSTGTADPAVYRWSALADDLLAVADRVSPDGPVDGIGVSMGAATLLAAAVRRPHRLRRLVLVIPPTAWATRVAQRELYEASARFIEQRGLAAWERGAAALPGPPVPEEAGATQQGPAVPEALLPAVLRGAAATDLPDEGSIAALRHPVLLLPWIGDPGHPVSTAERLLELLPQASMRVLRTAADLRSAGATAAAFLEG